MNLKGGLGMKKILSIMLALSMVVSATITVNASTTQIEGEKSFTLWHGWTGETDGNAISFRQVLESFAEDNPNISLDITGNGGTDYNSKLKIAFAANEGPDLFEIQGLGKMEDLVKSGSIRPLDDLIEKYGINDQILPGSLNSFTFDGHVYGLPTITGLAVLYCNTELLEEAGVGIPETWDDLLNAIDALNSKGITPFMYAGKDLWPVMDYYDILAIRTTGATNSFNALLSRDSFEQEGFLKAAELVKELTDRGAYNPDDLSLSWDEGVQKFAAGGAAMLFNGTWVTATVDADDCPIKGKVQIAKFPGIGGEYDNDNFGGAFETFCISSNVPDEDVEAAFQTIAYLCKHMSDTSLVNGNGLPAWKSDNVDTSSLAELIQQQVDVLNSGSDMCLWWDTTLGGEAADIHTSLVLQLVAGKITPEEYCAQMQSQIDALAN